MMAGDAAGEGFIGGSRKVLRTCSDMRNGQLSIFGHRRRRRRRSNTAQI